MKHKIILFFVFLSTYNFASHIQVTNYSTSSGLSHKTVTDIFRDSEGFLWVGTTNGLNRFDGYTFKTFLPDFQDSLSIGAYVINQIVEDVNGTIWIATSEGIRYYNRISETFHQVPFSVENRKQRILSITADDDGNIWACHATMGLIKIKKHNESIFVDTVSLASMKNRDADFFNWKLLYSEDKLWIAGTPGLIMIDTKNNREKIIKIHNQELFFPSIRKGGPKEILLTASMYGVYSYNIEEEAGEWIHISDQNLSSKNGNVITDALRLHDGDVCIASSPGVLLRRGNTFEYYHERSEFKNMLSKDISSCLHYDNENILWIGTFNSGIFSVSTKQNGFHSSFSYNDSFDVRAMIKSMNIFPDGSILYGNMEGLWYHPHAGNMEISSLKKINKRMIFQLSPIDEKRCIMITFDAVSIFNKQTQTITYEKKGDGIACALYENNIIWTGHWSKGLEGYNVETGESYQFDVSENLANNNVFAITTGSNGDLWIGTYGSGLVHIQKPTVVNPIIKSYRFTDGINSISQNQILSLHYDNRGNLWIGTSGGGLNCFTIETEHFTVFNTKNGLKNNVIEAITSDNNGNIWFSSNRISKYDVREKNFTHFTTTDGVFDEFNVGVCKTMSNGRIFFGGNNGLVSFFPDSVAPRADPKKPVITGLRMFGLLVQPDDSINGNVPYTRSITYSDTITLPYSYNSFSFEFSSLLFTELANTNFAYRMIGINNEWIPSGSLSRLASYSGLQPGTYTFEVVAINGDEKWSKPKKVTIMIIPPWWETLWFRIGTIFILFLIALAFIRYRINRIGAENKRLETEVHNRTMELELLNKKLELHSQSLKNSNNKLNEDKYVIEMKNEQLTESLNLKDKLISIIGHDFKNPLTTLQGFAALLKTETEKLHSPKLKMYSEKIIISSKTLREQMTMVFDWAQGQMKDLKYNPIEINIESILNDSLSLVAESAAFKNIAISTQFDYKTNAYIDPKMISTVFRNILTNAIKFTSNGGSIVIIIQELDTMLEISIADTGIGISKDKIESIFDPINTNSIAYGTNNEKGIGLGLQISKSFIQENKGLIEVKSSINEGTTFSLLLPKGEKVAIKEKFILDSEEESSESNEMVTPEENYSVLIIEDDREILDLLDKTFSKVFHVIRATDGDKGLQLAQQMLPDLIICDYNLPKMNGLELCNILKNDKLTNHIPFFLVTANSNSSIEKESYAKGVNDLIYKPFDPFILRQKSITVIRNRVNFKEIIIEEVKSKDVFSLPESTDNEILKLIFESIKENFTDSSFGIDDITKKVGLSRAQLWRKIKSTTGKNPIDIIREMRLSKAAEMLKTNDYRISEIAYHVGFSDPKYFSNSFSKRYGESPSSFSKHYGNKQK